MKPEAIIGKFWSLCLVFPRMGSINVASLSPSPPALSLRRGNRCLSPNGARTRGQAAVKLALALLEQFLALTWLALQVAILQ